MPSLACLCPVPGTPSLCLTASQTAHPAGPSSGVTSSVKPFLIFLSLVAANSVLPQTAIQSTPALPEVCLPSVPQIPGRSESGPLTSGTSGAGRGVWAPVGVTDEKAEAHSAHFASLDSFAFLFPEVGVGMWEP